MLSSVKEIQEQHDNILMLLNSLSRAIANSTLIEKSSRDDYEAKEYISHLKHVVKEAFTKQIRQIEKKGVSV